MFYHSRTCFYPEKPAVWCCRQTGYPERERTQHKPLWKKIDNLMLKGDKTHQLDAFESWNSPVGNCRLSPICILVILIRRENGTLEGWNGINTVWMHQVLRSPDIKLKKLPPFGSVIIFAFISHRVRNWLLANFGVWRLRELDLSGSIEPLSSHKNYAVNLPQIPILAHRIELKIAPLPRLINSNQS